ncbi:hypothetical protein [Clostridium fessum]|uniref:hypothetical protein n=1 Tax=Clostridium fessum TaxID=2126740 RepID=UPI00399A24E4
MEARVCFWQSMMCLVAAAVCNDCDYVFICTLFVLVFVNLINNAGDTCITTLDPGVICIIPI